MLPPSPVASIIRSNGSPPVSMARTIASPAAFRNRDFLSVLLSMMRPTVGGSSVGWFRTDTLVRLRGSLPQMRTRSARRETGGGKLRFVGHASVAEFHDAHRVGRHAVIAEYEFGDPEIAAADHPPDRKTLFV